MLATLETSNVKTKTTTSNVNVKTTQLTSASTATASNTLR